MLLNFCGKNARIPWNPNILTGLRRIVGQEWCENDFQTDVMNIAVTAIENVSADQELGNLLEVILKYIGIYEEAPPKVLDFRLAVANSSNKMLERLVTIGLTMPCSKLFFTKKFFFKLFL